jgi:3-oxoacyl-[acyl-carrier protein] reductase
MDTALADKVALVTGASGGIGQEIVRAFRAEGARVAALSRRGVPAEEGVLSLLADVRRLDQMEAAVARAVEAFGRVDACVINAGIWPAASLPLDQLPEARVREVVETNLLGAMWTARAFLGALRKTGPREDGHGASVVFIGSTAGRFGEAGHAEYAATKAALRGLSLSLKNEIVQVDPWARVNLVEPGWTVTPMAEAALEKSEAVERLTRTMPLRRVASTRDVAAAVVYLCSPALSRHVSGEVITVAGGMEGRVVWG